MVGGAGRAGGFALAGGGGQRGGKLSPRCPRGRVLRHDEAVDAAPTAGGAACVLSAEAGVDGAAGDVVGRGERPRAGADGVGDRVDERRGAVAPNHVNVVGSGGGADGSAECAVAVVDEAAVVAHVGVGKDDAGNAEGEGGRDAA